MGAWSQRHFDDAVSNSQQHPGYSADLWGLTACFDPWDGYSARAPGASNTGVVAPTAACSAYPYLPEASMRAMKAMYEKFGSDLWGPCGFKDSIALDHAGCASVSQLYLAIDQGTVAPMIENGRSGLLWKLFMGTPAALCAIDKLGLTMR